VPNRRLSALQQRGVDDLRLRDPARRKF